MQPHCCNIASLSSPHPGKKYNQTRAPNSGNSRVECQGIANKTIISLDYMCVSKGADRTIDKDV